MKRQGWLLIVLAAALVALRPLADASPPDPSWIPGIYDGDDFDDVVVLVTMQAGSFDAFPQPDFRPQPVAVEFLAPSSDAALPTTTPSSSPTRGPPAV
jgi:hypothetical protein